MGRREKADDERTGRLMDELERYAADGGHDREFVSTTLHALGTDKSRSTWPPPGHSYPKP